MQRNLSQKAYDEAVKYIPGGVNSPVRALRSVGEAPLFVQHAAGAHFTDVDGNVFSDFCLSWGVFILGHNHPAVKSAALKAIDFGTSYGIPSLVETELAKMVTEVIPSVEKVRFVSSGTEAVMSAIRVARGYTGKNIIVKFDGCYHGHADHLLVSAGSGVVGLSGSSSAGVPEGITSYTISIPYNDIDAVKDVFTQFGHDIAAVILEPVPANMGVILPKKGYLQFLREITLRYHSLLIFDEVITGFRLGMAGAQGVLGVEPDLTAVGKIIGGGFPAAAFGGKKEIMSVLAPNGPVYQAGTLSGNPVAMHAGLATVRELKDRNIHLQVNQKADAFIKELKKIIHGKPIQLNHIGSMFTIFFSSEEINNFNDVKNSDTEMFATFFRYLLNHNIYFSPSAYEASFISFAHSEEQLNYTLQLIKQFVSEHFNE